MRTPLNWVLVNMVKTNKKMWKLSETVVTAERERCVLVQIEPGWEKSWAKGRHAGKRRFGRPFYRVTDEGGNRTAPQSN